MPTVLAESRTIDRQGPNQHPLACIRKSIPEIPKRKTTMASKTRDRTVRSRKNAPQKEIPRPQPMPQMRTNRRNDTTHHTMSSNIGHHGMEHSNHLFEQLADKIQNQHLPSHSHLTTPTGMEDLGSQKGNQRPVKNQRSNRKTRRHRLVVLPPWSCRQIFRIVYG